MTLETLLHRWQEGVLSGEELQELIRLLETPEAREQLRREWFLESMLPEALKTAGCPVVVPEHPIRVWLSTFLTGGFLPAPGWRLAFGAVAVGLLVFALVVGGSKGAGVVAVDVQSSTCARGGVSRAVSVGMSLAAGDILQTGDHGRMELFFPGEGTRIRLEAGTTVEIRRLAEKKEFRLLAGSVDADVAHQKSGAMVWVTEDARARIVGTKFVLSAEGLFTRLDVSEGTVIFEQLADARPTTVRAGEFAAADAQTLVEAQPLTGVDSRPWTMPGQTSPGFLHTGFHSVVLDREIGVNVMFPPDYESQPQRRFPVLYLLHGLGGNEHSEAARFGKELLVAMRDGRIPPCIVVAPNTGPAFSHNVVAVGRMISRELPAFVDGTFRTLPYRKTRLVCGVGFGAQQAVILATLHPDVFSIGCAVDDTLRGGTPALQRMAPQMRARAVRTPSRVVLLATDRQAEEAEKKLAAFFSGVGVDTTVERLSASNLDDPALPALVFNTLSPLLSQQWKRPDSP